MFHLRPLVASWGAAGAGSEGGEMVVEDSVAAVSGLEQQREDCWDTFSEIVTTLSITGHHMALAITGEQPGVRQILSI